MGRPRENVVVNFWKHVLKLPGRNACWEWQGKIDRQGYGKLRFAGDEWNGKHKRFRQKSIDAHRFSYELHYGQLGSLCALHRCDNRTCVRPSHLFKGTRVDNQRDMAKKGRAACGERSPAAKLNEAEIRKIRALHTKGRSQTSLAKQFSVWQTTIKDIVKRKTWRHIA